MAYFKNFTPIKSNPWLALQESKRHFREQAATELDLLDQLTSEQDQIVDDAIDTLVVGASGRVYKFIKQANSTNLEVKCKNITSDGTSYEDVTTDIISGFFNSTGLNGINDILPNIGLGISSILADISNGEGFNTTMANICNAFQGAQELSYSDVYSVFNERANILREDKTSLLDMVKSLISKGKINSYSWLTLLSQLLSTTKDEVDDDNLLLDKTKPFILQSMVAFALLQAAPMVIASICFTIGKAIGAILYIIMTILSSIFSAINNAVSTQTTAEIDEQSMTDYVKGPLIYTDIDSSIWRNNHSKVFNYDLSVDDGFLFMPLGPIHLYQWKGPNWSDPHYMNGFWSIGWDWRKVLLDMSSQRYYSYSEVSSSIENHNRLIFDFHPQWYAKYYNSDDYYLDANRVKEIMTDPDKVLYEMYWGMAVWLFISNYMGNPAYAYTYVQTDSRFGSDYDYFRSVGLHRTNNTISPLSQFGRGVYPNIGNILFTLVNLPSTVVREDFLYDYGVMQDNMYDVFMAHQTRNDLVTLIQNVYTNLVPIRYNMKMGASVTYESSQWIQAHDGETYEVSYAHTDAFNLSSNAPYFYNEVMTSAQADSLMRCICYEVDSLPVDRGITIPSTSNDKLIAAVALVAVISAAVVAVTMAAKRALKLRATARKTSRAVTLNGLKEEYSKDPLNKDKKNAYLSEVNKYNIKASLFGWGSYDPANGWFNDSVATSDSTTSALLLGSSGDVLPNMMKDTSLSISGGDGITPAITLSHLSDENTISQDKIDLVVGLIRG